MKKKLFLIAGLALMALPVQSAIISTNLGTGGVGGSRPVDIDGEPVIHFNLALQDSIPAFSFVSMIDGGAEVAAACGTSIMTISPSMQALPIGGGWGTWSGGYTFPHRVYYDGGVGTGIITLTPPAGATHFSLYAEPNSFGEHAITVKANGGSTLVVPVIGFAGASGFGFAVDGVADTEITSVTVTSTPASIGFAIAEFSIDCVELTPPSTPGAPGRLTGGGRVSSGSDTASYGFNLRCDSEDKRQNMNLKWPDGNHFKSHGSHGDTVVSMACTDDPLIEEAPPLAGFDTMSVVLSGEYNGVEGATASFVFKDAGEPGNGIDSVSIVVEDAGGDTVLDIPLTLIDGGNIQAHKGQAGDAEEGG